MGITFDAAFDPELRNLCTATSHLTGETINRFTHIHQNPGGGMTHHAARNRGRHPLGPGFPLFRA
mgnify:CR=1 FL=1